MRGSVSWAGVIKTTMLSLSLMLWGLALWRANTVIVFSGDIEGIDLPIVMYHSILESRNGKYIISPEQLDNDLQYLSEQGFETVTAEDLIHYVYHDGVLPQKPIMLTFDDGHYNNLTYAVPILEKYDMRAVVAVVGSFADREIGEKGRNPNFSYFNWEEIGLLCTSDTIEVQNHSYDMHSGRGAVRGKGESSEQFTTRLTDDIHRFNQAMATHADYLPRAFIYPFGAYSTDSEAVIRKQGFLTSLICRERLNRITKDEDCLFEMGRYNRPAGISTERFFSKVLKDYKEIVATGKQ